MRVSGHKPWTDIRHKNAESEYEAALKSVSRAAKHLSDLHGSALGLPTLTAENLDAAVSRWHDLRHALKRLEVAGERKRSAADPESLARLLGDENT